MRTAKLHQDDYVRKLLKKYDMENCNPRDTPTEANFMKQVRAQFKSNPKRKPLGMENEYQEQGGELAWLVKSRDDICFLVGLEARFMRCAGPMEIGWLERLLRYLAHFPDKGRMIIPGKKLYLHGASDADWGGKMFQ